MKVTRSLATTHPFLSTIEPEHHALMLQGAKTIEYDTGEMIFQQGEPANRLFLIEFGKVAVEARTSEHKNLLVQTLGDGDALGWSWLFPPFSWHFQARALEPTTVLVLDGGHLLVCAEENHDFGYELMRRVAQVVIHRVEAGCRKLEELDHCKLVHPAFDAE